MKIIFTNGCFDILHVGHINLLEYAKSLGGYLIVGLNSDSSVKKLKGENRPINNEKDRKRLLQSLKFVDEVFIFDNDDELCDQIISSGSKYIVIGNDYVGKKIIGSEFVKNVIFFEKLGDFSTDRKSTV